MKINDVVFTGTQAGMTPAQAMRVIEWLKRLDPKRVHHGNCIGADEQFHTLVKAFFPEIEIHVHEATTGYKQAGCKGHVHYPPIPPLKRNTEMLKFDCDSLIATPKQYKEIQRSGTWSTIRKAADMHIDLNIILPNGELYGLQK